MDMAQFYRCPDCSTRDCAIVVRIEDKDEHIALHKMIVGGPGTREAVSNLTALNSTAWGYSRHADNR